MHLLCVCMCVCRWLYMDGAVDGSYSALLLSVCTVLLVFPVYLFTFTFMHLADAFIQSDLQCI